jgi:hypothetical protein
VLSVVRSVARVATLNLRAAVEILEAKNYQGRGFAPCSSSDLSWSKCRSLAQMDTDQGGIKKKKYPHLFRVIYFKDNIYS